ncbi:MAG TPA: sulfatase [Longimicrobiales bacterium]|nr:sulfatase [Longimicrobiales bacterium]
MRRRAAVRGGARALAATLRGLVLGFALGACGGAGVREAADVTPMPATERERPNILFVFTDDHAAHAVGAYGGHLAEVAPTANIDRLAREGMLFRNAFVTNSICAPSRAVILTGKHSHINGVVAHNEASAFDGSQVTFPKLLQQAGYQTALIGKWHLQTEPTGFDYWEVLTGFGGQGSYYNPEFWTPAGTAQEIGYTTDIITDKVLAWLASGRDRSRPFLLMYQHKAPHIGWDPGPDHLTLFDDVTMPEPPTLFDDYQGRNSGARTQNMMVAGLAGRVLKLEPPTDILTPEQLAVWNAAYEPKNAAFRAANLQGDALLRWKYQRYIKDYLRTIASVDDNLGRVLQYLDASGLAANTIVVYNSDQGFFLGDHGWFDKRWMYEESLRAPLIVRWPGVVRPGSQNEHLVQNLDLAETFLDAAGVAIPEDMQGRSLVPLLRGERPPNWRDAIYYQYYEHGAHGVPRHYGIRTDRYKLIHYPTTGEWELFDLREDPDELRSVYDDPARAALVEELKTRMQQLRDHYRVPSGGDFRR